MSIFEKYSLVWKECGKNSDTSKRFYVPNYEGYLPFFIWGKELDDFEKKKEIQLKEEHLLKGILYGLSEYNHNLKPWHRNQDKKTLLYLLDVLTNGFKFKSPEQMVLDVAYGVREKNGNWVSKIILEVGSELIPDSSKIKSDLICDLWIVFSENEDNVLLKRIKNIIPEIDFDEILSRAKQIVAYYGLCASVFLKNKEDLNSYLEKYIYPNVTNNQLKHKIKELLENPDTLSAKELIIENVS